MRKLLTFIAAVLTAAFSCAAQDSSTRRIDISLVLDKDGGALVREVWDMDIHRGTEWYLVRGNLGDIEISGLSVRDENGREFRNIGRWDVDRSMEEKSGKCGIVRKSGGCELCWGLGSYGEHRFTVEYRMSKVVKAMDDFDALHLQLVSPGISPRPQNVRVEVSAADGTAFSEENCAIWAFGFNGTDLFEDGKIVLATDEPFRSDAYSVILLARFGKGLFSPQSTLKGPFQDKLDQAFKGSSYQDYLDEEESERKLMIFALILLGLGAVLIIFSVAAYIRRRNLRIFGVKKLKEIGYARDIPFGGNLYESRYILSKIGTITDANFASALILRMVKDGIIGISHDSDGKVLLDVRSSAEGFGLNKSQMEFHSMLQKAAGDDLVLQDKEYSRWSRKHEKQVARWIEKLGNYGSQELVSGGYLYGDRYSPEAQQQARTLIGFRNYLKDFTLLDERKTTEVALWGEYIVFAALFGIADKVAKELKDINPQAFEEFVGYDYPTMRRIVFISNNVGNNIVSSATHYQTSSSTSGKGGFSSFGGGGGFSGGGFGGGAR